MNELERLLREVSHLGDQPYLMATVVRVSGSSYRRPGARMLVSGDRWLSGCISGGCLEGDVLMRGAHRARSGPVVVTYDSTTDEGEPWAVGLGCGGVVDVLVERFEPGVPNDALTFARACFEQEATGTLITVIQSTQPGAPIGSRLASGPAMRMNRPISDGGVREALEQVAANGSPGVIEVAGVTAIVERIAPSPHLFVLGSSHDATPLVAMAQSTGFRVTVADRVIREPSRFLSAERISTAGELSSIRARIDAASEAYVVVMHHERNADRVALEMALGSRARYIGVLGPARRTRELLEQLGHPGDPRIHAPVGLDIGAETPEQIAMAIVAELWSEVRGRRARKLSLHTRTLHEDVATIVLAAGGSSRLGRPKQLLEIGGVPLVRRVADRCLLMNGGPVAVVLGASGTAVAHSLRGVPVTLIANERWQAGMASSIKAGLAWARTNQCGALLVTLADQPHVPHTHLRALRDAWLAGASIAATRWTDPSGTGTVIGAPAIFDRSRWASLEQLADDCGARAMLGGTDVVAIDCPAASFDVDTEEDARQLGS